MRFKTSVVDRLAGIDRGTAVVLLFGGLVFAGVMAFALTGTVAADAGHEASSCMSRFV